MRRIIQILLIIVFIVWVVEWFRWFGFSFSTRIFQQPNWRLLSLSFEMLAIAVPPLSGYWVVVRTLDQRVSAIRVFVVNLVVSGLPVFELWAFYDEEGVLCWSCDIYGECIKAPTVYISASDESQVFKMVAKGKFFNATYYLEDSQCSRFATITRKGIGFRWKILDENDQEIARIIDPASKKEAFIRDLFCALPDGYAVVLGEELIATIKNEKLLEKIQKKPKNIFGKLVEKVFEPRGLTLRIEPGYLSIFDTRIFLAGITLL